MRKPKANKRQNRVIASIASKMDTNDSVISEALYNIPVKSGHEPIDQLILGVESQFIDWDWNDKKFQALMKKVYKGNPPASPDVLAADLDNSAQSDDLKDKLTGLLGVDGGKITSRDFIKKGAVAAAGAATAAAGLPSASAQPKQPLNLVRGQTYDVTYTNFVGKQLTFKGLPFRHMVGGHAIFEYPSHPQTQSRVQKAARQSAQITAKNKADIPYHQQALARKTQELARMPQNWPKTRAKTQRSINYHQNSIAQKSQPVTVRPRIPEIGLRVDRIVSAK